MAHRCILYHIRPQKWSRIWSLTYYRYPIIYQRINFVPLTIGSLFANSTQITSLPSGNYPEMIAAGINLTKKFSVPDTMEYARKWWAIHVSWDSTLWCSFVGDARVNCWLQLPDPHRQAACSVHARTQLLLPHQLRVIRYILLKVIY